RAKGGDGPATPGVPGAPHCHWTERPRASSHERGNWWRVLARQASVGTANQTPFPVCCSIPRNFTVKGDVAEKRTEEEQNMKTEPLSTDRKPKNKEQKIDDQLKEGFPTSDPPSFNPGTVGAPKEKPVGTKREKPDRHDPHGSTRTG